VTRTELQVGPATATDTRLLDCVVIGGGLAGGAAALVLARAGRLVVLIERTSAPGHKVCGDFLSGEAIALLRRLGLDPPVCGGNSVTRLRLVSGDRIAEIRLPFIGHALSRRQLDQAVLDLAASAGVEVIRGETVGGLDRVNGRVTVKTGHRQLQSRTAVLATGKHALRAYPRSGGRSTAFKQLFTASDSVLQPMQETVQLVAYDGGYIGAVRVEDGLISMAWLLRDDLLRSIGTRWSEQAAFLGRQSVRLGDMIAGLTPIETRPLAVSGLPYGFLRHQAIAANIYAVGDQLGVIPSLTGDGTAIALASGVKAAQAILEGTDAQAFQSGMIRRLRWQFRVAGMLQAAFDITLARRLGILAARSAPWLVRTLVRATRLRV
jgi:menaquinone-9 beta-reductase